MVAIGGLGIRATAIKAADAVKRRLRVGDYWYWLPSGECPSELPIRPLVEPLRYDVLVRRSFFEFYLARRDLYLNDPDAFLAACRDHAYFRWFRHVIMVRYGRGQAGDRERVRSRFADRVRASAVLHDAIESEGFDTRYPVILYTGEEIMPADSGRRTEETFYLGDGCHRLACLIALGHTTLPASYCRIKCFRRLVPFDNTALLEPHLPISWPEWPASEVAP